MKNIFLRPESQLTGNGAFKINDFTLNTPQEVFIAETFIPQISQFIE